MNVITLNYLNCLISILEITFFEGIVMNNEYISNMKNKKIGLFKFVIYITLLAMCLQWTKIYVLFIKGKYLIHYQGVTIIL